MHLSGTKSNASGSDSSSGQSSMNNFPNSDNSVSNSSNGIAGSSGAGNTTSKPTSAKFTEAGKHLGKAAEQAGRMSGSGHAGVAELNINPHKE